MVSETRFVGFWPWSDNRLGHFNMAPCWAGGRGEEGCKQRVGEMGRQQKRPKFTKLYPWVLACFYALKYYHYFHHNKPRKSHLISNLQHDTCVLGSIFNILSGSHCVCQCDCSDTAMQKGGCTWDPGNFITLSQAVSVQDPGLCAVCPALRTGNMAQTTLCVIATSRWALWYVHLPWPVLQIALMSLFPCLRSVASTHWSSPGCTTRSAIVALSANYFCHLKKKRLSEWCYAFVWM